MSNDRLSRRRARRLIVEMATRGIDPPTPENARDFLDLLDPTGEEYELAVEVADWIDRLYADHEASTFHTRALIDRARGTPRRKPKDKYWRIRALRLPPERERRAIEVQDNLTAMLLEKRHRRQPPPSPGGPASGCTNP